MINDSMRSMHINTFHCAECGQQLKVTYKPATAPEDESFAGLPTGAAMLHSRVSVWPCQKCLQPAKDAVQALTTLANLAKAKK